MAQVMYVHASGEPCQTRRMDTPKRASAIGHWLKEAKKAVAKDLGELNPSLTRYDADIERIVFYLDGGAMIVVDRRANALGR